MRDQNPYRAAEQEMESARHPIEYCRWRASSLSPRLAGRAKLFFTFFLFLRSMLSFWLEATLYLRK